MNYETIRCWTIEFGPHIAKNLKKRWPAPDGIGRCSVRLLSVAGATRACVASVSFAAKIKTLLTMTAVDHLFSALVSAIGGPCGASAALVDNDFHVTRAGTTREAEGRLSARRFDLLIANIDEARLGPVGTLAQRPGGSPLLALARHADWLDRMIALECGADELLSAGSDRREIASEAQALARCSRLRSFSLPGPNGDRASFAPNEVAILDTLLLPPRTLATAGRQATRATAPFEHRPL